MGKVKEELMNQEELRQELKFECMEAKMEAEQKHRLERYELASKVNERLSDATCSLMALDATTFRLEDRKELVAIQMYINEIEGLINESAK